MTSGQPAAEVPGNRHGQRVLVIIPTYNERENLPLIHRRVKEACPDVHVLIIDDNSPDGTGQLADDLAQADPGCTHVLHRTVKNGLGLPTWKGSPGVSAANTRYLSRWTPTAATRRNSCTVCWTPSARGPIWPSVHAMCPGDGA
ncbi:hypothetical protein NIIDMKKI_31130 [Mycobacterium kansasii]|uniref:Glycosyltransferase 2-like domain-containing protein n=1 Tax=Mycobacterium kansasii TaxID=1768 RepID=A0A7G1IAF7_MYCKA|nr:hypothetical protein NIIDMKKI_31130 [Mycobacterium kansasii]